MGRTKILVVEDEIFIARDIQENLEEMGYVVTSIVPSGEQAIQKIEEERPDIVLMDIVLQGEMDGIETAGIIHSKFDIPVIYLTAHGEEVIFERAKKTEPFGYIIKPFKNEELQKVIEIGLYRHGAEEERRKLIQKLKNEIAERTRVEEALKKSEEKYRKLIETAQDAIISTDEKGIINVWNQSAEKIFGYSKNEIIEQPVTTLIPERYKNKRKEGLAQFLKTGESNILGKTVELTGKTKEGNEIPIETSLSFRKTGKERYIFTAFIRDITFQKKVERKLVENAKELKTINKDLENFVYIVSHDLKEPLFTIEGYTARLSKMYKDALDEKGNLFIERIRINIEKMSQKIKEIMEVLKVGRVTYDFRAHDSGDITTEVIHSLEGRIKRNKVNVLIHDKLPTIVCDENRMKDILSNLIINAIKFMGEDEQRQISIGCDKNGNDYYKFYVEDTGIGIQKKYQEQIFTIFRRLKEIEAEGTGVGLSIVKKIVEQHKGSIWIESPVKDGKGTRFCFTIPVTRETSGYQEIQDNATQSNV